MGEKRDLGEDPIAEEIDEHFEVCLLAEAKRGGFLVTSHTTATVIGAIAGL